jgi:lysophospholipase L1-like esterase
MQHIDHKLRALALGDSYTSGEKVAPSERWPERLVELIRQRGVPFDEPHVVARTGWSTVELAAGVDRANPQGPFDLVMLQIGVNDQVRGRSLSDYHREFSALVGRAIAYAGGDPWAVIVLSAPDWGVTPAASGQDRAHIAQEIDRLNLITREVAWQLGAQYIDVTPISRLAGEEPELLTEDGLHPSALMYDMWAHVALRTACEALGIPRTPLNWGR